MPSASPFLIMYASLLREIQGRTRRIATQHQDRRFVARVYTTKATIRLKALGALSTYCEGIDSELTWLCTGAVRYCVNHVRLF